MINYDAVATSILDSGGVALAVGLVVTFALAGLKMFLMIARRLSGMGAGRKYNDEMTLDVFASVRSGKKVWR